MPSAKEDLESNDTFDPNFDSPKFDPKSKLLKTEDSLSHNKMVLLRNKNYKDEHNEKTEVGELNQDSKGDDLLQPKLLKPDDSASQRGQMDQYGEEKDLLEPKLLKTQDSVMIHRNTLEEKKLYKDTHTHAKAGAQEFAPLQPLKHQDSVMLNKKHIEERHQKAAPFAKPAIMELPATMKSGDEIDKGGNDKNMATSSTNPQPKSRCLNSSLEEMKPLDPKARHLDSLPRIRQSGKVTSYVGTPPSPEGSPKLPKTGDGDDSNSSQATDDRAAIPKSRGCIVC